MTRLRTSFAAACLAAAAVLPSAAQAQGYSEQRLVDSFDDAILTATLTEIGAAWETSEADDGTLLYAVTFDSGLKAFAYLRACDQGDCKGLTLIALFDPPEGQSSAEVDGRIRAYNDTYPAGKAFRGEGGSLLVQAYVISDYGITMGNLQMQMLVFLDVAERFAEELGG